MEMFRDFMHSVGWLDFIGGLLVMSLLIRGAWKGFIWQVVGLLAVILGLVAARRLAPGMAPSMRELFPAMAEDSNFDVILSYFLILIVAMVLGLFLAKWLNNLMEQLKLSSYDRVLGGVFGTLKAGAILVVLVTALSLIDHAGLQETIAKSKSGRLAGYALEKGGEFFPEEMRQRVLTRREEINRKLVKEGVLPPPPPKDVKKKGKDKKG